MNDDGTRHAAEEPMKGAGLPAALAALRGSAYRLGAALLTDPQGPNPVSSPFSALHALLLLRAGAGSDPAAELDEVLGLPPEAGMRRPGRLLRSGHQGGA